MRYAFWAGWILFFIASFAGGEVYAVRTNNIATLSESLRAFTNFAPQWPFIAWHLLGILAWHLWGPEIKLW